MLKILISVLFFAVSSYAIEMPINEKYYISIANGNFTVFEFPFKIRKTFSSGFLISKDENEVKKIIQKEKKDTILTADIPNKRKMIKKNKIIQIKQGSKSLTFLPRTRGTFKIIVWGYKKYPIMFNIKVVKNNANLDSYYKFSDYSEDKKEVKKFESTSHEKVIVKLIRSIYNKKVPNGYKDKSVAERFEDKVFVYTKNTSYIGDRYMVEEWYIKNKTDKKILLYEEQFLKDGIYAISFENNLLLPKKQTRMFIVKKTNNKERTKI